MERDQNPPPPGGQDLGGARGATLAARFLCELAMLAALAFWGYVVGEGPWAWLLGVGAPALAAVGLGSAGQPVAAVVLAAAGLVTSLLNDVQERRAGPDVRRR